MTRELIHSRPGQRHKGFTLVELMIVIAIVGVMAVMAVPSIRGYRDRAQINSASRSVAVAIKTARQMAQAGRKFVRVTATAGTPGTFVIEECRVAYGVTTTGGCIWTTVDLEVSVGVGDLSLVRISAVSGGPSIFNSLGLAVGNAACRPGSCARMRITFTTTNNFTSNISVSTEGLVNAI